MRWRQLILRPFFIAAFTGGLLLILIVIGWKVYHLALEESTTSHQMLQMRMARVAVAGIQYYLRHFREDLQLLASFPGLQYLEPEPLRSNVDYFYRHAENEALRTVVVFTREGRVVYFRGHPVGEKLLRTIHQQLPWIRSIKDWRQCWCSHVFRTSWSSGKKEQVFFILVPLVQYFRDSVHPHPSMELVGGVGYLISFSWLVKTYVQPLSRTPNIFPWIMDEEGRLLYHSSQPKMVGRRIQQPDAQCLRCHKNFSAQKALLQRPEGVGVYSVGEEPTRIMAHTHIHMANLSWVLVISSNMDVVTAGLRHKFTIVFFLMAVAVVMTTALGMGLHYVNIRRIRSEEARRHEKQMQRLRQQLDQSAKLASIGELVDSVVHEINTPAGVIAAQVDAMLMEPDLKAACREELEVIRQQTRRIAQYTRTLLGYSRRLPFRPQWVSLASLLDETLLLVGHRFRAKKIHVDVKLDGAPQMIYVDKNQIQQVLLNLFNNAVDAMETKGQLRIRVFALKKKKENKQVVFEVADNGCGIPAEDIGRIFDPFFTTKPAEKGTGLGLAISRAIVKQHGGRMEVESQVGEGSFFRVFLPLNSKEEMP